MRQGKQNDSRIKIKIRDFVEGNFVTIVMALVTIYALVGDDIRMWVLSKSADPFIDGGLILSFVLFTAEIILNTVVVDEFKYSFFFWLDIIATLSLIPDIALMSDAITGALWLAKPSDVSANAQPGVVIGGSASQSKIQKVVKSLRLIRLIRIIKLYKYIS